MAIKSTMTWSCEKKREQVLKSSNSYCAGSKYLPCFSQHDSDYEVITVEVGKTLGVGCLMLMLDVSHMHFNAIHVSLFA